MLKSNILLSLFKTIIGLICVSLLFWLPIWLINDSINKMNQVKQKTLILDYQNKTNDKEKLKQLDVFENHQKDVYSTVPSQVNLTEIIPNIPSSLQFLFGLALTIIITRYLNKICEKMIDPYFDKLFK